MSFYQKLSYFSLMKYFGFIDVNRTVFIPEKLKVCKIFVEQEAAYIVDWPSASGFRVIENTFSSPAFFLLPIVALLNLMIYEGDRDNKNIIYWQVIDTLRKSEIRTDMTSLNVQCFWKECSKLSILNLKRMIKKLLDDLLYIVQHCFGSADYFRNKPSEGVSSFPIDVLNICY